MTRVFLSMRIGIRCSDRLVGWAKARARPCQAAKSVVRRAHASGSEANGETNGEKRRGHGAREIASQGQAVPAPLPTLQTSSIPLHRLHDLLRGVVEIVGGGYIEVGLGQNVLA